MALFQPGVRSGLQHLAVVGGIGFALFAATVGWGGLAAWRAAFPAAPQNRVPESPGARH